MSTESIRISLVVWSYPRLRGRMPYLSTNTTTSTRASLSLPTPLPDYPWEKLATDLFHHNGTNYILLVDYYSRYVEVQKLSNTTSTGVISFLKAMFAQHRNSNDINGSRFSSKEFQDFATTYRFHHITSSPHFPQSNGLAERTVRTVKKLLQGSKDPFMALLSYHTTPCHGVTFLQQSCLWDARCATNQRSLYSKVASH